MRVLMISTDRNIFQEDSEVRQRIFEYGNLAKELHVVVYATKKFEVEKIGANVWVYSTNSFLKPFYFWDAYKIATSILGRTDFLKDWIITTQDPFETGLTGYWLKKKFGIPLQLQIHTDFLSPYFWRESLKNKIRVCLAKWLIKKADGLRVVSQRIKNSLLHPIDVLPIFVDIEKISNTPIKIDLHKKYSQYDFIILMASRFTSEKNVILAIEAFGELMKSRNAAVNNPLLLIVGDGPEFKKLKIKSEELKVQRNVIFEPWTKDLISYYKTADLFLLTSNYEGYGRTVAEAMAAGLPVAMSDVGLAGELVRNGENGLIFPVGDKAALKKTLTDILTRKIDLKELGAAAKKIVSVFGNKTAYLEGLKSSWEELL